MESSPTLQVPGAVEDDFAAGRPGGGASEISGRGSRRSDASPRPGTPAVITFILLPSLPKRSDKQVFLKFVVRRIGVIISHFLQLELRDKTYHSGSIQTTLYDPLFCPVLPDFNFVKCGLENSERVKFEVKLKSL